jgi:sporulation protein YlmC with PRC-barrel domain
MLGRSTVTDRSGGKIGQTVDAMIGSTTGRIQYLVVSAGGVAGVGERLHRVDWHSASFGNDAIRLTIDRQQFDQLPTIPKDHWPSG